MKCPKCNGRKKILEPCDGALLGTVLVTCDVCDGTGEITQTNFDSIIESPEALAHWICEHVDFCDGGCSHCPVQEKCLYDSDGAGNRDNEDMLVEWLKEAYKG